jgi:hypothetical protein
MILIRATQRPVQAKLGQMDEKFLRQINREKEDSFYKMDADEFRLRNREELLNIDFEDGSFQDMDEDDDKKTIHIVRMLIPISVLIILVLFVMKMR